MGVGWGRGGSRFYMDSADEALCLTEVGGQGGVHSSKGISELTPYGPSAFHTIGWLPEAGSLGVSFLFHLHQRGASLNTSNTIALHTYTTTSSTPPNTHTHIHTHTHTHTHTSAPQPLKILRWQWLHRDTGTTYELQIILLIQSLFRQPFPSHLSYTDDLKSPFQQ